MYTTAFISFTTTALVFGATYLFKYLFNSNEVSQITNEHTSVDKTQTLYSSELHNELHSDSQSHTLPLTPMEEMKSVKENIQNCTDNLTTCAFGECKITQQGISPQPKRELDDISPIPKDNTDLDLELFGDDFQQHYNDFVSQQNLYPNTENDNTVMTFVPLDKVIKRQDGGLLCYVKPKQFDDFVDANRIFNEIDSNTEFKRKQAEQQKPPKLKFVRPKRARSLSPNEKKKEEKKPKSPRNRFIGKKHKIANTKESLATSEEVANLGINTEEHTTVVNKKRRKQKVEMKKR
ncbi:hypothetical protein EIN_064440 [Entamoeba invadens IP1]|uniref:Uncharacterized protein n=1 Tax=Entamoeba invadens IP1 TaxID=370355 RepID=A0A0A1TV59_ENTIV|nr:hypothetical protein EIN_064440 [Entamoeba invadens IP1]ELP84219.1 hypothetical protein EIN_064440 [Entamoeba invadens IP1]|eukprot:XP_004183565.1 hypothetical protein EIN_064440 [Entamoeba invadens IP1]